ncbi:AMP-binding protein [Amycolatopsis sp. SID8362]|nr:AMP-binding protein [Amycolatopsis sp. SID8362]NBH03428.1 AMP-binding protein [Amycolatopsis sp. SID8362]NED40128.1 AMP-binding protein [Amycolatopsis sp. SID8362]
MLAPAQRILPFNPSTVYSPVRFAGNLAGHGDRAAVVTADGGTVSYRELDQRVSSVAEILGATRRLVLIEAHNDLASVVAYLAALRAGHPVLLTAADHVESLVEHYDPDVVLRGGPAHELPQPQFRRSGSRHALHPDLALLLSTSGSTGSPKLVRIAASSLQANADAIAGYLGTRPGDRAALSLPMHYCYGLSVINSNLAAGATLVLTAGSVTDPGFWTTVREQRVTSLHGVPHTFELLDRIGFDEHTTPHLRYLTQAGGRLAPETVRRYARMGERGGWQLFVMYGQTEATARMAYLPPDLAETRPGSIGRPIDGGSFTIADPDDTGIGELVYRGPNVMMGYARTPDDLALGRTIDALATGDLGRRTPDGLYEIIGRRNRFVKPFGKRIDLDDVELLLCRNGFEAACIGDDDGLDVFVTARADGAHEATCEKTGLPATSVHVRQLARIPRLANGKTDYPALRRQDLSRSPAVASSVRDAFGKILHRDRIAADDTFTGLGGDSLSYVKMSITLGAILDRLPPSWPTMSVRELETLRSRTSRLARVDTSVVLRAAAILLVLGTHIGVFHIPGGAHLMLALSGWAFARFALAPAAGTSGRLLRSAAAIALPAMLWIGWRATVNDTVGPANVLLVNTLARFAPAKGYWYLEVLVQLLLILAAVFAVPAIRRFERRHGLATAAGALAVALLADLGAAHTGSFPDLRFVLPGAAWFFALGWLLQRASAPAANILAVAAVLALIPASFGDPSREAIIIAGLLLLIALPQLALPRAVVRPVGLIADASLYSYLTHYAVFPALLNHLPPLLTLVACVALGIAARQAVMIGGQFGRRWRRAAMACAPTGVTSVEQRARR